MIPPTEAATASGTNFTIPSEVENSSFNNNVAESAVAAASETEEHQMATLAPSTEPSSLSTAVDIGPDTIADPKKKPQASFWSRLTKAATVVEEHLAEWFGLNDSKYQWAIDEAINRQLSGRLEVKPASSTALNELQTEPTSQQAMHRDTNEVDDV